MILFNFKLNCFYEFVWKIILKKFKNLVNVKLRFYCLKFVNEG